MTTMSHPAPSTLPAGYAIVRAATPGLPAIKQGETVSATPILDAAACPIRNDAAVLAASRRAIGWP